VATDYGSPACAHVKIDTFTNVLFAAAPHSSCNATSCSQEQLRQQLSASLVGNSFVTGSHHYPKDDLQSLSSCAFCRSCLCAQTSRQRLSMMAGLTDSAYVSALTAQALVYFNLAVCDQCLPLIVSCVLCMICRLERGGCK